MKPYWKRKWIEALESGKYRQGQGQLAIPAEHQGHKKYCCLGVLCEIDSKVKWNTNINPIGGQLLEKPYKSDSYLSIELKSKYGLTDDQQSTLAEMNDDGFSFKQIAKYIRENL